jgi:hypothetical protein
VSTATGVNFISAAISAVVKPPKTCITNGIRYSSDSLQIARLESPICGSSSQQANASISTGGLLDEIFRYGWIACQPERKAVQVPSVRLEHVDQLPDVVTVYPLQLRAPG